MGSIVCVVRAATLPLTGGFSYIIKVDLAIDRDCWEELRVVSRYQTETAR